MIINDFLSRQKHNHSNAIEIIPISFNMHTYYTKDTKIRKNQKKKYLVQMQSQTKSSGIRLLEVHGMSKNLDPYIKPEKQPIRPLKGNGIL